MQQWENLWPATLGKMDLVPPVQILTKQAEYFNEMMQNVLVAEVKSVHIDFLETISHSLVIKVPALGNYNAKVLEMNHDPIKLYPVTIADQIGKRDNRNLVSEKEVLEVLKSILRSKEMNEMVSSLLAQTRATMR